MLNECNWRHTCWNFWKRFGDWIHIFAPKPMTIVNFNFILCSMFIIKNWNASLVIVIGFGAKIWIQSPNLFQKFQQVWRQLHSLSIVDYPKLSMLTTLSRFFFSEKSFQQWVTEIINCIQYFENNFKIRKLPVNSAIALLLYSILCISNGCMTLHPRHFIPGFFIPRFFIPWFFIPGIFIPQG